MPTPLVLDLSRWQSPRDLTFAKKAGIKAVILKASQGVGSADPNYNGHRIRVLEAGLKLGAYHFGTGMRPGADQAHFFLGVLHAHGGVPPVVVLDLERNGEGNAPSMTLQQAEDFVRVINGEGLKGMLYGGAYIRDVCKIPASSPVAAWPLWLADYSPPATPMAPWAPNWTLWQFTDRNGAIPGQPDALDGYDLSDAIHGQQTIDELWP